MNPVGSSGGEAPREVLASDAAANAVEACLQATVRGDGLLGEACRHLMSASSAKRIRPRLLLAFVSLGAPARALRLDARPTPEVAAAAAVELIHTASLLHDDVVDVARERRGLPSVNARFGNGAAVLAGDVLLSRALQLLAFDARAVTAAIDVVGRMSAAAVREVELRGRADVSLAEYAVVSDGKTAALFGLCGRLAGLLLEDADAGARFETAAGALGLAFQLADDVGDVESDLLERTPTHPILAAAALDASVGRALHALWSSPASETLEARRLAAAIAAGAGPAASRESVRLHVAEARAALAPWAGTAVHEAIFRYAATLAAPGGNA